tara:strand:+ start:1589 stop:1849 length:261 start_codon:yes stop_codon:yes gene_type:complete
MTLKKKQLKMSDFFGRDFTNGNFALAQKIVRVRDRADNIRWLADNALAVDGEFAKLHASNIRAWIGEVLDVANATLEAHLDTNSKG